MSRRVFVLVILCVLVIFPPISSIAEGPPADTGELSNEGIDLVFQDTQDAEALSGQEPGFFHDPDSAALPKNQAAADLMEPDITTAQMADLMGSYICPNASSATAGDVYNLLVGYWLPNATDQLYDTFESFAGVYPDVHIRFERGLPDCMGQSAWAWTHYYGYGNHGANNHMASIRITINLEHCLSANCDTLIYGTGDKIKFDQIVAHELMHVMMAESAPGYVLGPTQKDWFNEGTAEMVGGGMSNLTGKDSSICAGLGQGNDTYASSYLAACYLSWLSACDGYGKTCTVSAANLAYGLDRILIMLQRTEDLNEALLATVGMDVATFERRARQGDSGQLQEFLEALRVSCTNSEGVLGAGSVFSGSLKFTGAYVVSNRRSALDESTPILFLFATPPYPES